MPRRHEDYYPTPAWCVRRLLEEVTLPRGTWLEPAAGDGAIIRAVNACYRSHISWWAVEARAECHDDLLHEVGSEGRIYCPARVPHVSAAAVRYDVIITNPPYSMVGEYLRWCLDRSRVVALLLRLGVLCSEERAEFMRRYPPSVYPLPNRPDFTGDGGDQTDYGWFVWRGKREGGLIAPRIKVLGSTSLEERRNDRPERKAYLEKQLDLIGGTDV